MAGPRIHVPSPFDPWKIAAVTHELSDHPLLQLPALTFGCLVGAMALRASPEKRRTLLFGSGILFGIAVAIKQSAALHPAALAVWIYADARRNRVEERSASKTSGSF